MAQTAQQSSRLDFLFEAGYSMLGTCPQLSRYYINEFQNSLTEFELSVPKQNQRFICTRCGQIQISGLSQKVRIVKKTKILNICLACQDQKKYHGTLKHKKNLPKNTQRTTTIQQPVTNKPPAINEKQPQKQPIAPLANSKVAIKKKNKGKKNNLQALLNKQQQQKQSSNNNSLNDFLSSL